MIRFTAEVAGVETLNRAFNRIDAFISDFRSVWPSVIEVFYDITFEQFESEGATGASGPWAALSPAYKKFKEVVFPGQSILRATDEMYESLIDPEALNAILLPEPTQLTIGTKDPKALAHQLGLGHLPARPIVSMTETSKRRIQKAIQKELVDFTRGLGFEVEEKVAA